MKRLFNRALPLLLTLALFVSLLSGLTLQTSAATVTYNSGSATIGGKTVTAVYNWGSRGTTATFLSPMAEDWYDAQNTSYAELSALDGASSTSSVPSSVLYAELADLMENAHKNISSYENTKNLFKYTDCQNGGGKISSFYSGKAIGPDWDGNWNREHTWPNSKGLDGKDEDDIMMLRPTSTSENSSRGNTAYGESDSYYHPNSESNGAYDLRGDVVRIMLYTYVRWGNTDKMWGSNGVVESKEVLIRWMTEDPVDTWELGRNDAVQSLTGTRNVFVDYPELAFLLFSEDIPDDYSSPSGEGSASSFAITASSNNTNYGTVSVSGNVINASPKTGYYAAGYTVLSGSATVEQNGNAFRVSATSNCSIRINFAPREQFTVQFSENGSITKTLSVYGGDSTVLIDPFVSVSGYTFVGWVKTLYGETATKPSGIMSASSSQSITGDTTFYALYSHIADDGSGGGRIETPFEFGEDINTTSHSDGVSVTTSYSEKSGDYTLSLTNLKTFYENANDATGKKCLKIGSGKSEGGFSFDVPNEVTAVIFKVAGYKTNTAKVSINGETSTVNTLSENGEYTTLTIDTSTEKTVTFTTVTGGLRCMIDSITYVTEGGGTTYYTTSTCDHSNTTSVSAQNPTCTESGYTAGVQCNACGTFVSGHEVVEALGHAYSSVVTPPTETEQGYTTHTCSRCGDTKVDTYVPALGKSYTVSFTVPTGVTAIADMTANSNDGITLPSAGVPTGDKTYTFLGWVETTVDNSTDKPAFYAAGANYKPTANTELIALYTYAENGGGSVKTTYTVSDYAAGTQYAKNEVHVLDDTLTVVTTDAHWTTELRLYSSSTNNGYAIFKSTNPITAMQFNAGNKVDTLNVYGSNDDGATWTLIEDVSITATSYQDYSVTFGTPYKWLKLDVAGSNQVRVKNFTLTTSSGTTYYTTVIGGSTEPDEPDEPEEENFTLSFKLPAGYKGIIPISGNGTVTLPDAPTIRDSLKSAIEEYTFVGWVAEEYDPTSEQPQNILPAGSEFSLDSDQTLYALFTYDEVIESQGGVNATLYEGALVEGDYVVVYNDVAMTNKISSNRLANTSVTIQNDTITAPDSAIVWHIAPYDETYWTFYNAAVGKYAAAASDNNKAQLLTAATDSKAQWSVKGTSTYDFQAKSNSRYLRRNGNYGFAAYSSSTGGALSLYKVGSSTTTTTYYTTKEGHDTEADEFAFFAGASVTLGDVLDLNFYVDATEGYLSNDLKVIFTYVGRDGTASDEMVYSAQIYDIDVNGYQFYLSLPAVYMATAVQAVLKDGNTVLQTVNYSIQEYAMSIIGGSYEQKDKNAATAMLNYGAMAQNYFGYKTDALANSTLTNGKFTTTDAELAAAGDLTGYRATITNRASNFIGYTLLLKDVTYIRLYFTEQVTVTLNGTEKTAVKDGDQARYYVEIPGVNAANLGTANTIVCGEMTVNNLSVLSLASQVAKDTTKSEAFRNAMIALILYAQSVKTL